MNTTKINKMGVNKIILVRFLSKDPEYKFLNNTEVANLSLAVSESYKDKSGEKKTTTEWVNCVV